MICVSTIRLKIIAHSKGNRKGHIVHSHWEAKDGIKNKAVELQSTSYQVVCAMIYEASFQNTDHSAHYSVIISANIRCLLIIKWASITPTQHHH